MTISCEEQQLGICPETRGLLLSPLEKISAWNIIRNSQDALRLGKYFYPGMKSPSKMPSSWWEIDSFLLGLLTERTCKLLSPENKCFIEEFILGDRYKKYRRLLNSQAQILGH